MKARYANVRNFNRVMDTYDWMVKTFKDKEFSAKDFKEAKKKYKRRVYSSLQFLFEEGIIKAVRSEKITKEIDLPYYVSNEWMVDKNGNKIMTSMEFYNLPQVAKKALLAMNGEDFKVVEDNKDTVEVDKFYYVINPDGLRVWRKGYSKLLVERGNKLLAQIAELTEKKDALMGCQFR